MQVHYNGSIVDKVGVRYNPGAALGVPFAVLDFGLTSVHVLDPADADEIIRAAVEAKRLLSPPDPCAGCGHAKSGHWEHAERGGPRTGCGYLGCPCTRYEGPADALAQAVAAGTPVIVDEDRWEDAR